MLDENTVALIKAIEKLIIKLEEIIAGKPLTGQDAELDILQKEVMIIECKKQIADYESEVKNDSC
jgi:hypothetical protein